MQQLQFQEMLDEIDLLKINRREWLQKTSYFRNHPDYLELLLRITYELTDKDFEYFVAYILKHEWFTNIDVRGWNEDGGIDIIAKKNGKTIYVQCKQWASPYITMKRAGEFYGTIYHMKKANPEIEFAYITTSYMDHDVLDFFHDHRINGTISNGKLLESCRELGLLNETWWQKMIQYIQQQRLTKIRKDLQTTLPVESELIKLQKHRILELRHHLSRGEHQSFVNLASVDYSVQFFQYWNLV